MYWILDLLGFLYLVVLMDDLTGFAIVSFFVGIGVGVIGFVAGWLARRYHWWGF